MGVSIKGCVENAIGLVRDYIPKKTSLVPITQVDLNRIAWDLNTRPRKRLGYATPVEAVLSNTGWKLSGLNAAIFPPP